MSHIRFISIPESWNLKFFLKGLSTTLNWTDKQQEGIKLIHAEDLKNTRRHIRVTFNNHRMLQEIMRAGEETRDRNLKSLMINGSTILYEVMDNLKEKYKLIPTKKPKSNNKSSTAMITLYWNDNLIDVIDKIHACKIFKIRYISVNNCNAFINFIKQSECDKFVNALSNSNYRVKYSYTSLVLEKFNHALTDGRNLINQRSKLYNKKNLANHKTEKSCASNNSINDELSKRLDEMSKKVEKVVESQNNFMPPINLQKPITNNIVPYDLSMFADNRHLFRPNMSAFDHNMTMLALQYPERTVNVPMIQGIVGMRNAMYNNPFF